jgi:hypothetical protein
MEQIKTLSDNKIWNLEIENIGSGITFATISDNNISKKILIGQCPSIQPNVYIFYEVTDFGWNLNSYWYAEKFIYVDG